MKYEFTIVLGGKETDKWIEVDASTYEEAWSQAYRHFHMKYPELIMGNFLRYRESK